MRVAVRVPSRAGIAVPRVSSAAIRAAILIVAAAAAPLVIALASSSMALPRDDDWAYYRIANTLLDTGHIHLIGWDDMTLIGHLLWGAPFLAVLGKSPASVHLAAVVATGIGLTALYAILRRFLSPGSSLFGTAVVGASPVVIGLGATYMTDLTSLAAQLACLAVGLAALSSPRRGLLLALALAIGFFGFTIREVALAAPVAVLVGHAVAVRRDPRALRTLAYLAATLVLASAAFYAWRRGLPNGYAILGQAGLRGRLSEAASAYFTLALLCLPALVLVARTIRRDMRTRPGAFAAGATLLLGLVKLASGSPSIDGLISSGGYLSRLPGGGDGQLGNAPAAVPDAVWWALDAACLAAGAMLAAFLAVRALGAVATLRRRRVESLSPAQWVLGAFAAGVLAILAIRMATGGEFYERYLLPAVPPLLVLLLTAAPTDAPRRAARSGGIAAVGALAALGLVLFAQTDSLKAGLWHAGQRLETAGFDARDVDAGFEWDGYHYRGIVSRPVPTRWRDPIGQYGRVFHRTGNCVAVAAAPVSETWMQPIAVERYTTLLGLRKRTLWLYRNAHACGPGSPSLAAARSALAPR